MPYGGLMSLLSRLPSCRRVPIHVSIPYGGLMTLLQRNNSLRWQQDRFVSMPYGGLMSFLQDQCTLQHNQGTGVSMPYSGLMTFLLLYINDLFRKFHVSMPYGELMTAPLNNHFSTIGLVGMCQCPMAGLWLLCDRIPEAVFLSFRDKRLQNNYFQNLIWMHSDSSCIHQNISCSICSILLF